MLKILKTESWVFWGVAIAGVYTAVHFWDINAIAALWGLDFWKLEGKWTYPLLSFWLALIAAIVVNMQGADDPKLTQKYHQISKKDSRSGKNYKRGFFSVVALMAILDILAEIISVRVESKLTEIESTYFNLIYISCMFIYALAVWCAVRSGARRLDFFVRMAVWAVVTIFSGAVIWHGLETINAKAFSFVVPVFVLGAVSLVLVFRDMKNAKNEEGIPAQEEQSDADAAQDNSRKFGWVIPLLLIIGTLCFFISARISSPQCDGQNCPLEGTPLIWYYCAEAFWSIGMGYGIAKMITAKKFIPTGYNKGWKLWLIAAAASYIFFFEFFGTFQI